MPDPPPTPRPDLDAIETYAERRSWLSPTWTLALVAYTRRLEATVRQAETRAARLEAALKTYGKHRTPCPWTHTAALPSWEKCTCGLRALLGEGATPE